MGFRRGGRFYNLRDRANGRGTNRNGQSYTAIKKATTDSKKTAADLIDAASKEIVESITGSNGGYVVQRPAKNPQETLYMDTPDVTTAKNVMRLNKDGIAFSTNGVGGPYSGALAINGKWFSQFIATWELTANIIKAGILQDAVGKNSINLDTGEVNLDCKSLKIQGKTTEEIAAGKASEAETAAKKAAADELNAYKEAVTKDLADMQGQIDGQIETWFFDDEPSPTTPPASDWTTDELKENHAGDLYYSSKGYAYRWTHSGGAWTWLQIKDTDITAALQNAKRAQETANSKRRTFLVQPTPPYDIGDLWANGTDLLACVTARGEGASYSANDWETKTDYTTKKTAQLIVDASIEKIELGIAEDVSATDFFSTAAWKAERGSYTATSGSVTIAGDTATVVAPDSTETGKRRAVVIDVPTAMLAATQGKRVTLSMRYRVNAEISGNAVIVLWANYESGNEARRLMTLATTSQTTPAGDWTTATLNYTFKDEKPTRVYLFAYLYAGAGSLSAELPIMSEATGKKSTISLTKDGTTISSFALDLSKYATGTELKVGLNEISASVVKNGEIRSKFALDSSSCTISAGTIKFTGNGRTAKMMNEARTAYYGALTAFSLVGTAIAEALGGWDGALKALVCIMAVDYITGVVCALIWHKSPKSADGTFESKASIKGLFRKGAILLVVLVAYKVDLLAGTAGVTRTAVILFFCANDGMSIVENLGIMGVPMPPALKDAFAVLRQKSGDEESAADETE